MQRYTLNANTIPGYASSNSPSLEIYINLLVNLKQYGYGTGRC
jgi:hypothetical protein